MKIGGREGVGCSQIWKTEPSVGTARVNDAPAAPENVIWARN